MGAGCSSEKSVAGDKPVEKKAVAKEAPVAAAVPRSAAAAPIAVVPDVPPPAATEELEPEEEDSSKRDPQARMDALSRCFDALDRDKSGTIDLKEVKQYLFKTGVNISLIGGKAEELLQKMDLNGDSLVSREEFTQMMDAILTEKSDEDLEVWVAEVVFTATSRNVVGFGDGLGEVLSHLELEPAHRTKLQEAFQAMDKDRSGFVELPEVKVLLGKSGLDLDHLSEEVTTIMAKLDKNGDQRISEQEFLIALSAVRKSVDNEERFAALLDNLLASVQAPGAAGAKPDLAQVLLGEDVGAAKEEEAKVEAAKEEEAKEEEAKEEGAKEEAAKEEAAKEEGAKEEAAKEEGAKEEPAAEEGAKEEPAKDGGEKEAEAKPEGAAGEITAAEDEAPAKGEGEAAPAAPAAGEAKPEAAPAPKEDANDA